MDKKRSIVLRAGDGFLRELRRRQAGAGDNEYQAMALVSKAAGPGQDIYIVKDAYFPGPADLKTQTPAGDSPKRAFQAFVYTLAYEQGLSVFDFHTHPWSRAPQLSQIDYRHGERNARYFARHFPAGATLGLVVFGEGALGFQGIVWNRKEKRFEEAEALEVLGSRIELVGRRAGVAAVGPEAEDLFARQRLIPGWSQDLLERLKVFLVGLGGNGALVFQSLVSMGAGRKGWIKACDPDIVEPSNLPRIPYADARHIGCTKAEVASAYARIKDPKVNVLCYRAGIQDVQAQEMAKEAHLLIAAPDNDGARKLCNRLSVRHLVPMISLGTEIIPSGTKAQSIAQVRTVLPGRSGCLMCCGVLDVNAAAYDLLDKAQRNGHARPGYVRGTDETPAASVLPLNGVTGNLALIQMMRIIMGEGACGKEFIHYDAETSSILVAAAEPNHECPVCGREGFLGMGDAAAAPCELPAAKALSLDKGVICQQESACEDGPAP